MGIFNIANASLVTEALMQLSLYDESVGGARQYNAGISESLCNLVIEAEDNPPLLPEGEIYNNAGKVGTGSEFATQRQIEKWKGGKSIKYKGNPFTDPLFTRYALGGYTVVTVEPGVYRHTIKMRNRGGDPRLISTCFIESFGADMVHKVLGVVANSITFDMPNDGMPEMTVDVMCSGKFEPVTAAAASRRELFLYTAGNASFQLGKVGESYIDIDEVVNKATFKYSNNIPENLGFYPGSGSQVGAQGQVAGRQLQGERTMEASLQLFNTDQQIWNWFMDGERLKMKVVYTSDAKIGTTDQYYSTSIELPSLFVKESPKRSDIDKYEGWEAVFEPAVVSDMTNSDLVTIEVVNDVPEYGLVVA